MGKSLRRQSISVFPQELPASFEAITTQMGENMPLYAYSESKIRISHELWLNSRSFIIIAFNKFIDGVSAM